MLIHRAHSTSAHDDLRPSALLHFSLGNADYQSLLKSRPTPAFPQPRTPRALYLIPAIYTYALIPVLPILADAGLAGFGPWRRQVEGDVTVAGGFGAWWGLYCVEMGSWWRISES
jgi:hypothetical protein